jgi:hypothetical protein
MTTEHLTLDQRRFLINVPHSGSLERRPETNSTISELLEMKLVEAHPDQNPEYKLLVLTDAGRLAVSEILKNVSEGLEALPRDADPAGIDTDETSPAQATTSGRPLPEFNFQTYFDPAHARAMQTALDNVLSLIGPGLSDTPRRVRETIASIIVNLATAGERDADKLAAGCLALLPSGIDSSADVGRTEDSDLL